MRVLVTGGAGFIGSHVVDALRARGDEPLVLDNFASGSRENLPVGFDVIVADISDPATTPILSGLKPDAIIHAAAQVSVPRSMTDPACDRAVNLIGMTHVIDGARQAGGCRVVFLSSGGAIYGETEEPATEASCPKPKSFYSIHKYAAEKYLEVSGLPYAIARLSNVYGPRQRSDLEGGVVAIFAEQLTNRLPITIYGSGQQNRDLVHVADVVSALMTMLEAGMDGMWNVGTGHTTTINQLLSLMEDMILPAAQIQRAPQRVGDVFSSCLSVEKVWRELGWSHRLSLPEGVMTLDRGRLWGMRPGSSALLRV